MINIEAKHASGKKPRCRNSHNENDAPDVSRWGDRKIQKGEPLFEMSEFKSPLFVCKYCFYKFKDKVLAEFDRMEKLIEEHNNGN